MAWQGSAKFEALAVNVGLSNLHADRRKGREFFASLDQSLDIK